jgi:predicted CxxxxCH...CXXCH cytochrome family protein
LTYAVAVSRPVGGTIRSADGKIDCGTVGGSFNKCEAATYAWTDKVVLSAIPDANQFFISWAGDCADVGTCAFDMVASPGADKWVVAVFNATGQLGHTNFASPGVHGPAYFRYLAGAADAPRCQTCHGLDYKGLSIAPSCVKCHETAGWTGGLGNCTFCHGTVTKAGTADPLLIAPPDDINGRLTSIPGVGVGAHQIHLMGSSLSAPVACGECHVVPMSGDTSHASGVGTGGARATLTFGPLATRNGAAAAYAGSTSASGGASAVAGTCSNVYCHGATIPGGGVKSPKWTQTDGSANACNACHGAPPPLPHPQGTNCTGCHPGYTSSSVVAATHVNGTVDVLAQACGTCHAMPPALTGVLVPHADHSTPAHPSSNRCDFCHPGYTSTTVNGPTHVNGAVEVVPQTCTSCHGSPPPPYYGATPSPAHPASGLVDCGLCHTGYGIGSVNDATHANGTVNVFVWNCASCHDIHANEPAPLVPLVGVPAITGRPNAVGAHRAHLEGRTSGGVALSSPFLCETCHAVPADIQHVHGVQAVVALSAAGQALLGSQNMGSYDAGTTSCSTYCHGTTLNGGTNKAPAWASALAVASCTSCHAAPPSTRGHVGVTSDLTKCAPCHRESTNADGTIKFAANGTSKHVDGHVDENVSSGHNDCATCHSALVGTSSTYHHVMGTLAANWTTYPGNAQPTTSGDKNCAQCHLDHDFFTAARGSNLRNSIANTTASSTDADLCVSCHKFTQTKDQAGQKNDQTLATYALDTAAFAAGGHAYTVGGSIAGAGLDFNVACTKCHNSNDTAQYQDGAYTFGLHTSTDRRLRAALGRTTVADDVAEEFCYRCHSNAGDAVGGTPKTSNLSDWYGVATMPPGSTGIFTQMVGTPAITTTTANTDTLFFKPSAQETPGGGPSAGSADGSTGGTSVLYLTSQGATTPPGAFQDTAVTFDTTPNPVSSRQFAMSLSPDTVQTTATVDTVSGSLARYDKVAQFLSPPLARGFSWNAGPSLGIYLNRAMTNTNNNCYLRYAVYKWSNNVATSLLTAATNNTTKFPTAAATSSTSMTLSGTPTFAAGDQILVEISIYKNSPTNTATGACTLKWGLTATDQTRLTLPATSDGTYPEFQASPALAVDPTWVGRSMSPFAPSVANEINTGTGTASTWQSTIWKRASFTSPPVSVATTLPAAAWTLNVYDSRGSMGSSGSPYLRYRIFRWSGTQGPDIVPWRTHTTVMGSSVAVQAISVPASAVTATSLAVGDRIVVELETLSMNLTAPVANSSTIVFGSTSQSSVVMPAKVTFDYTSTTPAAWATVGHLGGLYTGVHRPNPAEETLARIAAAKHVECSDCHDPHGAKRGNQADGGNLTTATTGVLTDSNQRWANNAWVGFYADVPSVTGTNRAQIVSNDATTLTLGSALSSSPAVGAAYRISMRANGGVVSSATANTLTDTQNLVGGAKAWQTNVFAGWTVRIVLGTGVGQSAKVLSNTGTQLTIEGSWATPLDTTSIYVVDRLPNVMAGAGGVNVTAWDAGTPTSWNETKTLVPAAGSATSIPDATTQWQVCFKCHSAANTSFATWKAGWTDLAAELNPRNQSYHPIMAPAAAFAAAGYGNTQLAANQLANGWKPGDMMYCSDCHGNNDTGYGASQGPHASAVSFVLRGPNTRWPSQADGTTRWTINNSTTALGTKDGLFCRNCHPALSGVHTQDNAHQSIACTYCHIQIPHGGKLKRLIRTTGAVAPYADTAVTTTVQAFSGGASKSSCRASCTTVHNSTTISGTTAW